MVFDSVDLRIYGVVELYNCRVVQSSMGPICNTFPRRYLHPPTPNTPENCGVVDSWSRGFVEL